MPQAATLRVQGFQEFMRACNKAEKESKKFVRDTFRDVGEIVRVDAAASFARYSPRSAAGYRTYVRQRGVAVEQRLRKTTGLRGDWGATQMRKALLPSMVKNEERIETAMETAVDKVCDHFETA